MLRELHISGLGVIDDLDLDLDGGLTVLTGETGAGKTMVTVGLSLALGARSSTTLVRAGARAARVQARFDAPPSAGEWAEDGEVVLARTVAADGKGGAQGGRSARDRVDPGGPRRRPRRGPRAASDAPAARAVDADGVRRSRRWRRSPGGAGDVPRGARAAGLGTRRARRVDRGRSRPGARARPPRLPGRRDRRGRRPDRGRPTTSWRRKDVSATSNGCSS